MKTRKTWLIIALLYAAISAPNATVIKAVVGEIDPYYWTLIRFAPILLLTLPMVIKAWPLLRRKRIWWRVCSSGLLMAIGVICYVLAIEASQASYVSIVSLTIPIIIIVLSALIIKERISARVVSGITLAALGAMVIVVLPVAFTQGATTFYPVATILALINCFCFGLGMVLMRQTSEKAKVPLSVNLGFMSFFSVVFSAMLLFMIGDVSRVSVEPSILGAALYSGLGIAWLLRIVSVKILANLGAATDGAVGYFGTLVAIIIPIVVLGERLSITMVIGGILILAGLYIVEYHKHLHHKERFAWRQH